MIVISYGRCRERAVRQISKIPIGIFVRDRRTTERRSDLVCGNEQKNNHHHLSVLMVFCLTKFCCLPVLGHVQAIYETQEILERESRASMHSLREESQAHTKK